MASVSDSVLILLSLITIVASLIAYYLKIRYSYWQKQKIPSVSEDLMFKYQHKSIIYRDAYRELTPHPFGGYYSNSLPGLLIRDPDLIQRVLIKDFHYFRDRGTGNDEKLDPLSAHLFNVGGETWRNIRLKIIPAFSSGKLKRMFGLLEGCATQLDGYIESHAVSRKQLELKELFSKFALDVIGTCAFGIECNALSNENSEFRRITRILFTPSIRHRISSLLNAIDMRLNRYLVRIKRHPKECEAFFKQAIQKTIEYRHSGAGKRTDFLQHLINLQQEEVTATQQLNSENILSDEVLAANSFVFFVAGFETISLTLTYCLLELALNSEIFNKVRTEMEDVKSSHGSINYEAIKQLSYADMVISETLRKYPVLPWIERTCVEPYKIPGTNTTIQPGTKIIIPTLGLHHDPEYFPNPEKFDPERFSEANRDSIQPGTYLPFGNGPRICIGMRFALLEIKLALAKIVLNYDVKLSGQINLPVEVNCDSNMMTPKHAINMIFMRSNQ